MLTEKEREWPERRKVLCTHCDLIARGLCQVHSKTSCSHWDRFHCNNPVKRYKAFQDMQDAAKFEALVAVKLAQNEYMFIPCYLSGTKWDDCPHEDWDCNQCRIKYARLAVEQEMDDADRK